MTNRSLAPTQAQPNPRDAVLDRIERELHRLRDQRPGLEDLLDRAANILVTHLSCPKSRTVRVRIAASGRRSFLVAGSHGAVYSVDPSDWSCSCPDAHRRGKGCKHSLVAYVLHRAAKPAVRKRTCCGCDVRLPRRELVELHPENHDGMVHSDGDLLCQPCANRSGVMM